VSIALYDHFKSSYFGPQAFLPFWYNLGGFDSKQISGNILQQITMKVHATRSLMLAMNFYCFFFTKEKASLHQHFPKIGM
jgi:hypothetical protein